MLVYDKYCYSCGKAVGEVSRIQFDIIYNTLTQTFKRVTGRTAVPPEAEAVLFMYVSQFMQQADKGTITSERLGDYTYIRTDATVAEMLADFERAIQEYATSDSLPVGVAANIGSASCECCACCE